MSKPRVIHTIWTFTDSFWSCTFCECIFRNSDKFHNVDCPDCSLADYLLSYGFDIPETIDYCLAHSHLAKLKFRLFGSNIHIYLDLC